MIDVTSLIQVNMDFSTGCKATDLDKFSILSSRIEGSFLLRVKDIIHSLSFLRTIESILLSAIM
jgi:hypothetical protein